MVKVSTLVIIHRPLVVASRFGGWSILVYMGLAGHSSGHASNEALKSNNVGREPTSNLDRPSEPRDHHLTPLIPYLCIKSRPIRSGLAIYFGTSRSRCTQNISPLWLFELGWLEFRYYRVHLSHLRRKILWDFFLDQEHGIFNRPGSRRKKTCVNGRLCFCYYNKIKELNE